MTTLIDFLFNSVCDMVDDLIQEYQNNAPVVQKWYTPELIPDDEFNNNLVINNSISKPIQETKL